jgi:hypothetical protein
MSRRRYVIIDGDLVDVTDAPAPKLDADSGALWSDKGYTNCRATDGTVLDTRTKHREYMRSRGLTTIDDFPQHFERAAEARARHFQGAPDPSRAHDIARAWEKRRGG